VSGTTVVTDHRLDY